MMGIGGSVKQLYLALFVALGVSLGLSPGADGQSLNDVAFDSKGSAGSPTVDTTDSVADRPSEKGITSLAVPASLRAVLEGAAPNSIDQLRDLEAQQRRIAPAAAACTVSVQIKNSQGCGVIVTGDGYVLTAAHVAMRKGLDATLKLSNGRTVRGKTLGLNREVDAGMIKIIDLPPDGKVWPHATLGTSKGLRPGMWCMAMGHPGGFLDDRSAVMRVGRILAVRPGALVTDCALIGGDSGGPLFDLQGKLIGVHSRIGNDVADNLHVPVDHYGNSWKRLVKSETWGFLPGFRPVIGVKGKTSSEIAEITEVIPESSADRAGVMPGDVVLRFGDASISDFASLIKAVSETMPGEQVPVRLRRDGGITTVFMEVGRDPNS